MRTRHAVLHDVLLFICGRNFKVLINKVISERSRDQKNMLFMYRNLYNYLEELLVVTILSRILLREFGRRPVVIPGHGPVTKIYCVSNSGLCN